MTDRRAIVLTEHMHSLLMAILNDAVAEDPDKDIRALHAICKSAEILPYTRAVTKSNANDYDAVIDTLRKLTDMVPVSEETGDGMDPQWQCVYCGAYTPMTNEPANVEHGETCPWKRAETIVDAGL